MGQVLRGEIEAVQPVQFQESQVRQAAERRNKATKRFGAERRSNLIASLEVKTSAIRIHWRKSRRQKVKTEGGKHAETQSSGSTLIQHARIAEQSQLNLSCEELGATKLACRTPKGEELGDFPTEPVSARLKPWKEIPERDKNPATEQIGESVSGQLSGREKEASLRQRHELRKLAPARLQLPSTRTGLFLPLPSSPNSTR